MINNSSDPTDDLLTPQIVAAMLGVRVQTLATWRTGRGPSGLRFIKVGSVVRYRRGDVLAFLNARLVANTTEGAHL